MVAMEGRMAAESDCHDGQALGRWASIMNHFVRHYSPSRRHSWSMFQLGRMGGWHSFQLGEWR